MGFLAVALPALAMLVALLLIVEVRNYRAGRHLISRRRLALRLVAGSLTIALIGAIFAGVFILRLLEAGERPEVFLTYWGACIVAAFGLIFIMLADVREVEERGLRREHEMWRDLARFLAGQIKRGRPPERPGSDGESQT